MPLFLLGIFDKIERFLGVYFSLFEISIFCLLTDITILDLLGANLLDQRPDMVIFFFFPPLPRGALNKIGPGPSHRKKCKSHKAKKISRA